MSEKKILRTEKGYVSPSSFIEDTMNSDSWEEKNKRSPDHRAHLCRSAILSGLLGIQECDKNYATGNSSAWIGLYVFHWLAFSKSEANGRNTINRFLFIPLSYIPLYHLLTLARELALHCAKTLKILQSKQIRQVGTQVDTTISKGVLIFSDWISNIQRQHFTEIPARSYDTDTTKQFYRLEMSGSHSSRSIGEQYSDYIFPACLF